VPWCERCDRFLNPNTVQADGTCPVCGRAVEGPAVTVEASGAEDDDDFKAPWHFWVMIAAAVIYLGWRFVEGVWWGIQQLF
jgi:hypothetical protein